MNAPLEKQLVLDGTEGDIFPMKPFAEQLAAWTRDEPIIINKGVDEILAQFATGHNVLLIELQEDGTRQLIGYLALYHLVTIGTTPYWELGTVIIDPAHRGRRLAKRLYDGVEALHATLGGVIYSTTKDPRVVKIGSYHGLAEESYDPVPADARHALCYDVSCFVPAEGEPTACQNEYRRGGTCYLCVRQ